MCQKLYNRVFSTFKKKFGHFVLIINDNKNIFLKLRLKKIS